MLLTNEDNRRKDDCPFNGMSTVSILDGLNEQQKVAVTNNDRILFVNAGPGSGKTHLLTSKLVRFIEESTETQKIVALSYTNTAAYHIGEKFIEKMDTACIESEYELFNGTIHSFCYRMLRNYHSETGLSFDYVIIEDEEMNDLAEEVSIQLNRRYQAKEILPFLIGSIISQDKELDEAIIKMKQKWRVITIDDILSWFRRFLQEDDSFRRWISTRITAVAVDEAQDLSEQNYMILDGLVEIIPGMKVFLVGDPRQNIFEFNGGSYENLRRFLERHQQCSVINLTVTYRCPKVVVDYVNTFVFNDCSNVRLASGKDIQGKLHVECCDDEQSEASYVTTWIELDEDYANTAILCNNMKYLHPTMNRLNRKGIPYKVLGGKHVLKEYIRMVNHILRFIDSGNEYSMTKIAAAGRVNLKDHSTSGMTRMDVFLSSEIGMRIAGVKHQYESEELPFCDLMNIILTDIMRIPEGDERRRRDFGLLRDLSANYRSIQDYLAAFAIDKSTFSDLYENDYVECRTPVNGDEYVTISTIHSAKGLEWDNVFVVGMSDGNFPNPYFCRNETKEGQLRYYNTELKKMYVAATRTRKNLYLTYSRTINRKGYTFKVSPSRFLPKL